MVGLRDDALHGQLQRLDVHRRRGLRLRNGVVRDPVLWNVVCFLLRGIAHDCLAMEADALDLAGIAPAEIAPHAEAYADWIAAGMQGEMGWLARDPTVRRRADDDGILPGARSVVWADGPTWSQSTPTSVQPSPYTWARWAFSLAITYTADGP